jgi:hypothetical protein
MSAKAFWITAPCLILVILIIGFQQVSPEQVAAQQERLRQSELRLEKAKERLQRAWDGSVRRGPASN